jgi:hypothetical protein
MKKINILRYNDLRDLMYLTHEHHLNGVVVDDAALEVMLRIEKTMQRLEVMGDDITAEQIADIIAAAEWEPQIQVKPINNKEQ